MIKEKIWLIMQSLRNQASPLCRLSEKQLYREMRRIFGGDTDHRIIHGHAEDLAIRLQLEMSLAGIRQFRRLISQGQPSKAPLPRKREGNKPQTKVD